MALNLIETTVKGSLVRVRFANDADPAKATEWIDIQVASDTADRSWRLAGYQRDALQRVRDVLDTEIQDARGVLGRFRD